MPHKKSIITSPDIVWIHPTDGFPIGLIFEDDLPEGFTLTGIDNISVDPTGELILTNPQINSTTFNDQPQGKGRTVPASTAVLGECSGQVAGEDYLVTILCTMSDGINSYPKTGVFDVRCRSK